MRNIFKLLKSSIWVSILLLTVYSCTDNDVDPLFDQTINERVDELRSEYINILTTAENGWIGYYSPNKDFGAYAMLMDFDNTGFVSIKSDYLQGAEDNTITYRIDKTLKLELVLETHAVFHTIYEFYNNNNDGEYVFNILSATEDEIVLESKTDYGDDITIFTLRPATASDLDLEPTFESLFNLAGDGTESVFRNVLLNDQPISSFSFNPYTRVGTITFIENGAEITITTPVALTPTGFYFLEPVDVNGTLLTSFTYDESTNEYVNTSEGLRIIYDNEPAFIGTDVNYLVESGNPIFLYRPSLGSNVLTSPSHDLMINTINEQLSEIGYVFSEYSLTMDFSSNETCANTIRVIIQNVSDGSYAFLFYCFNQPTVQDGKLFLSYAGTYGDGAVLESVMTPIINMFNSDEGMIFTTEGTFSPYPNIAGTYTSIDNPSLRVYGLFF